MGVLNYATFTASPAAVAANTTAEQTFALAGADPAAVVLSVSKPTAQAGLGIVGWRIPSAGNIAVTFINATGAAVTPTAGEVYRVAWLHTAQSLPKAYQLPVV